MKQLRAHYVAFIFLLGISWTYAQDNAPEIVYESEELILEKISEQVYRHISYLHTEDWGKIACNGMLVLSEGEALVADTPASLEGTEELINWLTADQQAQIKAVIATHFHADCLIGLPLFHQKGVPSYGYRKTPRLAQKSGGTPPQQVIESYKEFKIGQRSVQIQFVGNGHTRDNLLVYVAEEEVLFGGCLVKSIGAGEGNLEDAVVREWSKTMASTREVFPNLKVVIPGHGLPGGTELLDYTANLFSKKR
ncbi:metallo-beta-lactamase class B [Robiginitalea myxolifaciens]|uniref:beta-lactamase n=1 Tax=Robiginitalea myxolifaciens TaxID=400055 RepID=A0A1I6FMV1_9FLAO|nr:subclass B1 metallo-beta-lactamase [Robiginitalea myxolifaciens]SFR31261.1 metallo-beta-lactamase class B [Robiginitalea myxolifaciens]